MEIGGSDPPIFTSALDKQTKSSPVSLSAGYAPRSVWKFCRWKKQKYSFPCRASNHGS